MVFSVDFKEKATKRARVILGFNLQQKSEVRTKRNSHCSSINESDHTLRFKVRDWLKSGIPIAWLGTKHPESPLFQCSDSC